MISGLYTQSFDVGNVTSFSYNAAEGRRYYFAVAAYAPGPVTGPRSREVWAAVGVPGSWSADDETTSYWSSVWQLNAAAESRTSRAIACATPIAHDCVPVQTIAQSAEPITSLAAAADGRIFYVEGGRRIRVASPSGVAIEPVLSEPNPAVTLNQVAVDPAFAANGLLWVSETESRRDGARHFRIVRYRVTGNLAGERAEIIPAVPLPRSEDALFTIDPSGSIYVALPAFRKGFGSAPGRLLRVNSADASDIEVFASGYASPAGLTVDFAAGRLWLSGSDGRLTHGTSFIALDNGTAAPVNAETRTSLAMMYHLGGKELLSVTEDGAIERAKLTLTGAIVERQTLSPGLSGRVAIIVPGESGQIIAAVQVAAEPGGFAIVRIQAVP